MSHCSLCVCSLLLDNERWKQAEVPAEFQDLVDSIADGRITLPDRKHTGSKPSFTVTVYLALINGFLGIQIFSFFFINYYYTIILIIIL